MEKRKNPEKELRSKSGLFFQIGLLMAMMLCVSAFEYRTQEMIVEPIVVTGNTLDEVLPPITIQNPPSPPPKPKIITIVEVPDDKEPLDEEPFIELVVPLHVPSPTVVEDPPIEKAPEVWLTSEVEPMPEGGYESFYNFVRKNLKYPQQAKRLDIEGKVIVNFIVNEDGELVDFEILKGIGAGCDEEVLRIMRKAPKWNPGKQRGIPVRVKRVIPIEFRLN
ncbi:MAG TPA: TonB family protein [Fulvivirga sp.]|nr:TonB family protein [Fulvivirga sp.]